MAGLRCDISAEVNGCASLLKEHFEGILRPAGVGAGAADVLVDVCAIEDILKSALPLEELFALREAVREACGVEQDQRKVQELKWEVKELVAKVAELEDR